ncbi:hypothetical protein RB195_003709 [Necator americanus]
MDSDHLEHILFSSTGASENWSGRNVSDIAAPNTTRAMAHDNQWIEDAPLPPDDPPYQGNQMNSNFMTELPFNTQSVSNTSTTCRYGAGHPGPNSFHQYPTQRFPGLPTHCGASPFGANAGSSMGPLRPPVPAPITSQGPTYIELQTRQSTSSSASSRSATTAVPVTAARTSFPQSMNELNSENSPQLIPTTLPTFTKSGETMSVRAGLPSTLVTSIADERCRTMHVMPISDEEVERPPRHNERTVEDNVVVNILHYEFRDRVGPPFKCHTLNLWVDGFCGSGDPTRFSLGSLGNSSRQPGVIPVRGQIGKGMQMQHDAGRTTITCLGESPIFVQAPLHAKRLNDDTATVYRLSGVIEGDDVESRTIEIFDETTFEKLLEEARMQGYRHVYALQNLCLCRVSFVKGFGKSYRRTTILDTPCWIEIHFMNYLQRLDEVLSTLHTPAHDVHSFS